MFLQQIYWFFPQNYPRFFSKFILLQSAKLIYCQQKKIFSASKSISFLLANLLHFDASIIFFCLDTFRNRKILYDELKLSSPSLKGEFSMMHSKVDDVTLPCKCRDELLKDLLEME